MNLNWIYKSGDDFCKEINEGKVYNFARYGDAEWAWLCGKVFTNSDGHDTFENGSKELASSVIKPNGTRIGTMNIFRSWGSPERKKKWQYIYQFIKKNNMLNYDWYHACLWINQQVEYANKKLINPLVTTLRNFKHKIIIVGPKHCRQIKDKIFNYDYFIEIPNKNCYIAKDKIYNKIIQIYKENNNQPCLVGFSSGFTSNILINKLSYTMDNSWLLDFGSIWEPYFNIAIRGYQPDVIKNGGLII